MKKRFALLTILALLLPVLAGCQSTNSLPPQNSGGSATGTTPSKTTLSVVTPPETTAPVVTPTEITPAITADEAIAIALNDAGLKKEEIRDPDVELDRDAGTPHYDVDFEGDGYDYDYEIDAATGKILKSHKERD